MPIEITSIYNVFFSGASIFIFYHLDKRYRAVFLVLISCIFIAGYSLYLLIYLLAYSIINFYLGIIIPNSKFKIHLYRLGIFFNIFQLVLLKYSAFAVDPILHLVNDNTNISLLSEIIVPVGISYFTLQGIGYLINVKMGWEKSERNFLNFLLYNIFYPKFISGPIERSNHFLPQLNVFKPFDAQQVSDGCRIVLFGFFKKIAIANQMSPFISESYANISSLNGSSILLLLFLQPLYLYFDFSGYTDIAIGFAKTFGITLLPNFNRPFFSENMTTFWKRFHISLSSWFNDYIFKQISYKYRRWGILASSYAVFVTFVFFGIWHGSGWNFMVLGFLQALAINYEYLTKKWRIKLFSKLPVIIKIWTGRGITYLFYAVSLVFFFSPDIDSSLVFFSKIKLFSGSFVEDAYALIPLSVWIFILVSLSFELIQNDFQNIYNKLEHFWQGERTCSRLFRWTIYSSVISILFVLGRDIQQFIYSQF